MPNISGQLEEFISQSPTVKLAAFADLSAGMVLAAKSNDRIAQETLDRLCAEAQTFLGSDAHDVVNDMTAAGASARFGLAWHGKHSHIFVGSTEDPSEAILIIAENPVAPLDIAKAGQDLLTETNKGAQDE